MTDKIKITPEAVVAKYRETGIKPVSGRSGIHQDDGVYTCPDGKACALGVMRVGLPVPDVSPEFHETAAVREIFDLDYVSFYSGFDGVPSGGDVVPLDRQLGADCRKAVIEAGFVIGID